MNIELNRSPCAVIDISGRKNQTVKDKGQPIIAEVITDEKEFVSHAADAIKDKEKLNDIILSAYLNGDVSKITAFIFGINTGFRVSDILDIRVSDITTNGKCNDWYAVREQKTKKPRQVWLNDTVKKAIEFLIKNKGLEEKDYLFVADKNQWLIKYIDLNNPEYLKTGKTKDAKVSHEYDSYGNKLPKAPTGIRNLNAYFKDIALKCGIDEHCSTHCMRQTHSYWFRNTASNEEREEMDKLRNAFKGVDDAYLAQIAEYSSRLLSKSYNHSSQSVTKKHYEKVLNKHEKARQLLLNLGKEAVDIFVDNN